MNNQGKNIFVCSPIRGNISYYERVASKMCKRIINQGDYPFSPLLYFGQLLNSNDAKQKEISEDCTKHWLSLCTEVYCITIDNLKTENMKDELAYAKTLDIPVRYFTLQDI